MDQPVAEAAGSVERQYTYSPAQAIRDHVTEIERATRDVAGNERGSVSSLLASSATVNCNGLAALPVSESVKMDYEEEIYAGEPQKKAGAPSGKERTSTEDVRPPKRKNLYTNANRLASKIKNSSSMAVRVEGFIGGAARSTRFCGAVAAALLVRGVTYNLIQRELQDVDRSKTLFSLLQLWAKKGAESREMEGEGVVGNYQAATRDVTEGVNTEDYVANVRRNRPLAARCVEGGVCFICYAAALAGEEPRDMPTSVGASVDYCSRETMVALLLEGGAGAMEAMARAHNREQHALNGNIHFESAAGADRASVMEAAGSRIPDEPPHVFSFRS